MTEEKVINLPQFPDWKGLEEVDSTGSFWSTEDFNNLNNTLIRTTLNLKQVSKELTKYEILKAKAEFEYNKLYRRTLLSSSAKTETQKKQIAEMACEEYEVKILYYTEIIKQLNRISQNYRTDLDVLKTLCFNLRQEMKL